MPDSTRGWALVFLYDPGEGESEGKGWFISVKGVPYGHLLDKEHTSWFRNKTSWPDGVEEVFLFEIMNIRGEGSKKIFIAR